MVIVIIKMNVLPEKCLELKQTLLALIEPIRNVKGCLSHNVFQDIENDNSLSLIGEWESRKDLVGHLHLADGHPVSLKPTIGNHNKRGFPLFRIGGCRSSTEVDGL